MLIIELENRIMMRIRLKLWVFVFSGIVRGKKLFLRQILGILVLGCSLHFKSFLIEKQHTSSSSTNPVQNMQLLLHQLFKINDPKEKKLTWILVYELLLLFLEFLFIYSWVKISNKLISSLFQIQILLSWHHFEKLSLIHFKGLQMAPVRS